MDTTLVPLTFRVPLEQRRKLRSELLTLGVTLQAWGEHVVAEHLGLMPREDVKQALAIGRETASRGERLAVDG